MDKVGIGILGAGSIAHYHAPAVGKAGNARLVAICDPDKTRATQVASQYGAEKTYASLDEMLGDPAIEGVVVCTPNFMHRDNSETCAKAGRGVLCEKPISITLAEALSMQKAADEAKVQLRTGFNQRFLNQVKLAKFAIDEGVIGEIHAFRSVFSGKWNNYFDQSNFRYLPEQSGGTTINDNLVHRYDMIRHLLDDDFESVVADLHHSVIPPVVDDNVHMIVRTKKGARGTFAADRFSTVIADSTDIYGTKGSIHLVTNAVSPFHAVPLAINTSIAPEDLPKRLTSSVYPIAKARANPGWTGWMSFWPEFNDAYAEQIAEFADAIRGNRTTRIGATGIDGIRSQELIQAAYESQLDSRWISLPLTEDTPYRIPAYS